MQIVCKKRLRFQDFDISISPTTKEKVAKLIQSYEAAPSLRPQTVPDFVVNDDLFFLAIADGTIVVIGGEIPEKKVKLVTEEPSQSLAQPMQPAAELTEADLALLNRPVSELIAAAPQQTSYPTTSTGWPSTKSI